MPGNRKDPRVTVCMPTHNRAHWLQGSIQSVLAQTYEDFVLIVSDNASTDETPQVVRGFDDPRIEYVRLDENIGLVGNHNQLLGRIRTDYAIVLPDDDIAYADLLARTVPVLDEHPRVGMVHAELDMIGVDDEVLHADVNWTHGLTHDTVESGPEFIRESMKFSCRVCASTALMRTAALPQGFFDPADFPPVDLGLWLRMALDWDMAFTAHTLAGYRIHGQSHSAAFGDTIGAGYAQELDLIRRLKEMKLRFIDRFGARVHDPDELRRLAEWSMRRELLVLARTKSVPQRKFRPTLHALRTAVGEDRRVLFETAAWRLLVASMLGARMTERLLRLGRAA
jgi:glycosyltransferase involved in cell wall biosynthesis